MAQPELVLIESSAWIEFLRGTGSGEHRRVRALLEAEQFSYCEPVRMELLIGARGTDHSRQLSGMLARGRAVATQSTDWEDAAILFRQCRHGGETVRKAVDCLIAAIAIRKGLPVLHADRDFEVLARHTELRVAV